MKIGRTGLIDSTHNIIACYNSPSHCHSHHIDELPEIVYHICAECGHSFKTPRDLLDAHNDAVRELYKFLSVGSNHAIESIRDLATPDDITNTNHIHSCPYCQHAW